MIVPSLYANKAFYDSTSALSGNPFSNNSTCGVSGTLKDCGLAAFPGGNIGYANRIEGVNGWFDIFSEFAGNVIDRAAPVLNQAFDALLGQGQTKVLEAAGYKMLGPVTTIVNGVEEAGIKAQKKDGSFIILLKGFREVPFTSAVAAQTRTVDPKTGLTTGQTLGIGVGVVAAVALLFFFMSKRR
jgi:LPXTG-motif cell wall-anchored protein